MSINAKHLKGEDLLGLPLIELVSLAHRIRRNNLGNRFELCSIMNAKSGLCNEDCKFCAQSSLHKADIPVYPLKEREEIVNAARTAKEIGAERFGIVTSGNSIGQEEIDLVTEAIYQIQKDDTPVSLCASLGVLNKRQLRQLKEAGLTRYHHNIETSPRFYPHVVSSHHFQERINTIHTAKELGLEVCSGGIIGMGETWQDRLDMAYILKELDVDSVPINLLVPVKGTPLQSMKPISCRDAIKTIAIFRIILEDKTIKIAAGRETILKDFQATGFLAGANGMLIGGYLTIQGREIEEDRRLFEEIKEIWTE